MKKLLLAVGIFALLSGVWTTLSASTNNLYTTPNNSSTAVVRGGVASQTQLTNGLKQKGVKELYAKLGIPTSLAGAKEGIAYANGEVKVDGKVVATDALSYGRSHRSNNGYTEADGVKFYKHSMRAAFAGKDTRVFVFFNADGSFKAAVAKVCGNPIVAKPKPVAKAECKALTATITKRDHYQLTAQGTADNGATIKGYKFVIKNAAGATVLDRYVATGNATRSIEGTLPAGSYTAEVQVHTSLGYKASAACKTHFTVAQPPVKDIVVCDLTTKKIVTIKENQFNATKHSKNLNDCKEVVVHIPVCELATKKVITINEKNFDAAKHSKNLDDCKEPEVVNIAVCELATKKLITIDEKDFDATKHSKNVDDCKEVVVHIPVCELETKEIVTIDEKEFDETKHSKDAADCEEVVPPTPPTPEVPTPEVPTPEEPTPEQPAPVVTELPKTGNGNLLAAALGLGLLTALAGYNRAGIRKLLGL